MFNKTKKKLNKIVFYLKYVQNALNTRVEGLVRILD